MKSKWNSLVVGGCNVLGLALLALSVTASGSTVRAAGDSPSLESVALESVTKMVSAIERRAAALETSVTAFAHSFTAKRIAAQELCIADQSGAQTCITKVQLDALLKSAEKTAEAEPVTAAEPVRTTEAPFAAAPEAAETAQAAPEAAHENAAVACSEKCVAPTAVAVAAEPPDAVVKEAAPAAEPAASAVKETAPAEGRTAAPDEPDQHQAADREAGTAVSAEAVIPAPLPQPAESQPEAVIATATRPAGVVPAEPAAKAEEPETAAPATTGAAPAEPKTAASADSPASERKE